MADTSRNKPIDVRLSQRELDTITKAARLEGFDPADIATWVRAVVLEQARGLVEKHEAQSLAATLKDVGYDVELPPAAGTAGGTCACGHTRNPRGDCDGSCVMRV
jgi:hypothetical protein